MAKSGAATHGRLENQFPLLPEQLTTEHVTTLALAPEPKRIFHIRALIAGSFEKIRALESIRGDFRMVRKPAEIIDQFPTVGWLRDAVQRCFHKEEERPLGERIWVNFGSIKEPTWVRTAETLGRQMKKISVELKLVCDATAQRVEREGTKADVPRMNGAPGIDPVTTQAADVTPPPASPSAEINDAANIPLPAEAKDSSLDEAEQAPDVAVVQEEPATEMATETAKVLARMSATTFDLLRKVVEYTASPKAAGDYRRAFNLSESRAQDLLQIAQRAGVIRRNGRRIGYTRTAQGAFWVFKGPQSQDAIVLPSCALKPASNRPAPSKPTVTYTKLPEIQEDPRETYLRQMLSLLHEQGALTSNRMRQFVGRSAEEMAVTIGIAKTRGLLDKTGKANGTTYSLSVKGRQVAEAHPLQTGFVLWKTEQTGQEDQPTFVEKPSAQEIEVDNAARAKVKEIVETLSADHKAVLAVCSTDAPLTNEVIAAKTKLPVASVTALTIELRVRGDLRDFGSHGYLLVKKEEPKAEETNGKEKPKDPRALFEEALNVLLVTGVAMTQARVEQSLAMKEGDATKTLETLAEKKWVTKKGEPSVYQRTPLGESKIQLLMDKLAEYDAAVAEGSTKQDPGLARRREEAHEHLTSVARLIESEDLPGHQVQAVLNAISLLTNGGTTRLSETLAKFKLTTVHYDWLNEEAVRIQGKRLPTTSVAAAAKPEEPVLKHASPVQPERRTDAELSTAILDACRGIPLWETHIAGQIGCRDGDRVDRLIAELERQGQLVPGGEKARKNYLTNFVGSKK